MRQLTQIVPQHIHDPEHYVRFDFACARSCMLYAACILLVDQDSSALSKCWSVSQEVAIMAAFTPYGSSEAAAIVACILYFMFFCFALANYFYTNYPFYDVLIIATACKYNHFIACAVCKLVCLHTQTTQFGGSQFLLFHVHNNCLTPWSLLL